jgi:hypothetical protein
MVISDIVSQELSILHQGIFTGLIVHPREVVMRRRYDPLMGLPSLCIHHWLCGDQDQLVVHAVCKKCGAKADFPQEPNLRGVYHRPQPWNDPSMPWVRSADEVGAVSIIGGY